MDTAAAFSSSGRLGFIDCPNTKITGSPTATPESGPHAFQSIAEIATTLGPDALNSGIVRSDNKLVRELLQREAERIEEAKRQPAIEARREAARAGLQRQAGLVRKRPKAPAVAALSADERQVLESTELGKFQLLPGAGSGLTQSGCADENRPQ